MFERVLLGITAVIVMLMVLIMMQMETQRLKRANEAMLQDMRDTRHILETAASEIDSLRDETTKLQANLDESASFIAKLRAELIAQSFAPQSESKL